MPRTGTPPVHRPGSGRGAPSSYTRRGAAGEDDGARPAPLDLGPGGVERQQLRVDVELADAPGDQLGVLAAEVEDDDGVGLGRRRLAARDARAGNVEVGTLGRRGVEGDLEVGLDLGVVGRQDAVTGVGGLAVDGLAAPAGRVLVVVERAFVGLAAAGARLRRRAAAAGSERGRLARRLVLRLAHPPPPRIAAVRGSLPADRDPSGAAPHRTRMPERAVRPVTDAGTRRTMRDMRRGVFCRQRRDHDASSRPAPEGGRSPPAGRPRGARRGRRPRDRRPWPGSGRRRPHPDHDDPRQHRRTRSRRTTR